MLGPNGKASTQLPSRYGTVSPTVELLATLVILPCTNDDHLIFLIRDFILFLYMPLFGVLGACDFLRKSSHITASSCLLPPPRLMRSLPAFYCSFPGC